MNLGVVLGLLGELIPAFAGVLAVVYFGGIATPKFKDQKQKENFEKYKLKHGKKLKILGYFLIVFGLASAIRFLFIYDAG